MKQRSTALALALALALSLCAGAVLADETPKEDAGAAGQAAADADGPAAQTEEAGEPETEAEEAGEEQPSLAGPDPEDAPAEAYVPDEVGAISFANLERRMRENNLNVLALQENIDGIQGLDYDKMYESLRESLNGLAKLQWGLVQMNQSDSYTYGQLEQAYGAMREQFDAIKDGELQADNAGAVRQLKNLQDQVLMGGEALYVAIADLQYQASGLQRQLAALNRTVEEMELRYDLGQVSALQLQETKAGRASLASGLDTLQMNLTNLKTQLELLVGAELTGAIALGAVPEVTAGQLEKMDLEADLLAAKEASYELYAANETLKDAKENYIDSLTGTYYLRDAGKHTWQADQHIYNATVQDYELRFRTLYAQVGDYRQIWEAAKVSLAARQASYASSELKFQQGAISQNALLAAEDELRAAEDAVHTAAIDLFSAYNTYCWAVRHGILN